MRGWLTHLGGYTPLGPWAPSLSPCPRSRLSLRVVLRSFPPGASCSQAVVNATLWSQSSLGPDRSCIKYTASVGDTRLVPVATELQMTHRHKYQDSGHLVDLSYWVEGGRVGGNEDQGSDGSHPGLGCPTWMALPSCLVPATGGSLENFKGCAPKCGTP